MIQLLVDDHSEQEPRSPDGLAIECLDRLWMLGLVDEIFSCNVV